MSSIHVLVNEVVITTETAEALWRAIAVECAGDEAPEIGVKGGLYNPVWEDGAYQVMCQDRIAFDLDHGEHIDYFEDYPELVEVLKMNRVRGDICFGALEGRRRGEFWGYRFDGVGGMTKLVGQLVWSDYAVEFKPVT